MAAFNGMRGTASWVTDQRPKNWREMILRLYPNGSAPLTAILALLKSERTSDPEFNWWSKTLPSQAGAITDIYTDANMATSYVSGGVAGDVLYVKVALATAQEMRAGHVVLLRDESNNDVDVVAKVTEVVQNGASSRITVTLLEADDNATSNDLSDADRILIVGNVNPEGGVMPDAIAYDAVKWYNYTQIFRTPLSITRTARLTRLRTGDAYQEAKRECLELHSMEMEKALLWGIRSESTGNNGQPERTTDGIIPVAKANGTTSNYVTDETYDATTWLNGGETWLDEQLEIIFRYGETTKMAFCGSGAMLGIQRLAKNSGTINLQPAGTVYGMKIMEWVTPFGTIYLKTHPMFSYEATNRNSMLIFEPKNLKERYITQTKFYGEGESQNTGSGRIDGTNEEYLTEIGLEYHFPEGMGWLTGFNQDNPA